jgi:DNA-binding transcriptional ArsR family regulator
MGPWPLVSRIEPTDAERMDIQPPQSCVDMNLHAPPPEPITDERLAALAKAMGNPNRVRIVRYLSQCRPHIENDIVAETGLAQSTISEHIRALRDVGIVTVVDDPPRIWYCVNRAALTQLAVAMVSLPRPFAEV